MLDSSSGNNLLHQRLISNKRTMPCIANTNTQVKTSECIQKTHEGIARLNSSVALKMNSDPR